MSPPQVRKTVSIVRSDVTGSTALGEAIDPEVLRRIMGRYFVEMRAAIEGHGGLVEKFIGDAVMAVFGVPQVHEDDALRAVRAAVEMREALARLNEELDRERALRLEMRIGITCGTVVAGDPSTGESYVTGDAANVAARLEAAAPTGEILLDEAVYRLVAPAVDAEPLEPLRVKGKAKPLHSWRLLNVHPDAQSIVRHFESPLVGRTDELLRLRHEYVRAKTESACRLVTIAGEPGIGKSRLARELVQEVRNEATALSGRCLPYGDGITYWPLVEMLGTAAKPDPRARVVELLEGDPDAELIAERLAGAIGGAGMAGTTGEILWAARRLFERLGRQRPLVVVLDDLQWGEATFLDLVEHVALLSHAAPILMLCLARPELYELRPDWPGERIQLTPLATAESTRLVTQLQVAVNLAPELVTQIAAAAEGNPLFAEQMAAVAAEEGAGSVAIPETIQALLAARLDLLGRSDRQTIECASVIGEGFWGGAVRHLAETEVTRPLLWLIRQELIRPTESVFPDEDGFQFVHLLIRDVAYESLSKESRARLHERAAEWLERKASEGHAIQEEIVGHHLEQAYRYRSDVEPGAAAALAEAAGERLAASGRRAYLRGDTPAAVSLLSRAAALLPVESTVRDEMIPDLIGALTELGEFERAYEVAGEARTSETPSTAALASVQTQLLRNFQTVGFDPDAAREDAERAIPIFERHGDHRGLARAWLLLSELGNSAADRRAQAEAARRSAEHARLVGDPRAEAEALRIYGGALVYGDTPATEAIALLEPILEREPLNLMVEASAAVSLAALKAMREEIAEARGLIERARTIYRELGLQFQLARLGFMSARVEQRAGDLEAAVHELEESLDSLVSMGELGRATGMALELAVLECERGRFDRAHELYQFGESIDEDDFFFHAVKGRVLAARGDPVEGEQLAVAAAERALETTGDLDWTAAVLVGLAEIRTKLGKTDEAAASLEQALGLYRCKGDLPLERTSRALLDKLSAEPE